jgi:glycosyltransferase involved in cell wall biosynthesis
MVDRAKWEALGPWAFRDACVQAWRQGWRTEASGEAGERPEGAEWLALLRRNFVDPEAVGPEWRQEIARLNLLAARHVPDEGAMAALRLAAGPAPANVVPAGRWNEGKVLAATSGRIRRYAGEREAGHPVVMPKRVVMIVSPYLPYPLSHGGAVRIFNLMREAAERFDLVLVSYAEQAGDPPPELGALCREIVLVEREGSHDRALTGRPEMVEEFDQTAMRAAIELAVSRWNPAVVQIEFTWMAQFADACGRVPKILVEHDITFDLWEQRVRVEPSPDNRRELEAWRRFETEAWGWFDRVAVMSEVDAERVGPRAVVILNGVDGSRFQALGAGEDRRVLFVGSFRHRPNLEGLAWLVREVWKRLKTQGVVLEVIAGLDHEAALEAYGERIEWPEGTKVRGFVADVRPSYERAALALVPMVTSAGTNIKVLEAMALGKAVVSTRAGVNGLRFEEGVEIGVARDAGEFAVMMDRLLADREARLQMGRSARGAALRFDWGRVGTIQAGVWEEMAGRRLQLDAEAGVVKGAEEGVAEGFWEVEEGGHRIRGGRVAEDLDAAESGFFKEEGEELGRDGALVGGIEVEMGGEDSERFGVGGFEQQQAVGGEARGEGPDKRGQLRYG